MRSGTWLRPNNSFKPKPRLNSGVSAQTNLMRILQLFLLAILTFPSIASADGFRVWDFGISRDEVKAKSEFGPYYSFRNGDLGSQAGPLDGRNVPISFYFTNDRLTRVMLIAYSGEDIAAARDAMALVTNHLRREFGGVQLPDRAAETVTSDAVLAAFDQQILELSPGDRFQAGAHPMPSTRKVWASVTAVKEGLYMVALNYAEP